MINSSNCSILDIPDEILVKIILHLCAEERLTLGNSCQRFNNLVFGDAELLRNLKFTGEEDYTTELDIKQYFNNENTYKKILRINIECVLQVTNLSSSISKAINLVELNILKGFQFESVEELSCSLKPLVHLKRLSVDWPDSSVLRNYTIHNWNRVLEESFSRLTYLSLRITLYKDEFLYILQLCHKLEELHLWPSSELLGFGSPVSPEPIKLSNLKLVRLSKGADRGVLRRHIISIIPNPAEWTDFYRVQPDEKVYFERNVEVCPELIQIKEMPVFVYVEHYRRHSYIDGGWPLVFEHLLSEVIRVTHEDVPEKFCCLSASGYHSFQSCLPKDDEAKKLLKDPRYQISQLRISHVIEKNCDVHLLGSAFPNLTNLFLRRISNRNSILLPEETKLLHRHLRKKGSPVFEEDSVPRNTDSSFKMLIENTPHLQVLAIYAKYPVREVGYWDLDALDLISGWKNLTIIHLGNIPTADGKFLIDIGKECKKLEEVTLYNLRPDEKSRYESNVLQMLQHCKNLRKFTIWSTELKHMSEMFGILSNCSRLEDLYYAKSLISECNFLEIMPSVEKMIRQCRELKQFSISFYISTWHLELRDAVQRIISELNRPNLRFRIV